MKYPQVYEGEWVQPDVKGYKIACCDCGLVHTFRFRKRKGKLELMATRNNRSTGQVRRRMKNIL